MKTFLLTIIIAISSITDIFGQSIAGSVIDEQSKPLEFATISLIRSTDSSLVKTVLTDTEGIYLFDRVSADKYVIAVSVVGYKKGYSNEFVASNGKISIPPIKLEPDSKTLKEVTVTAQKPFIERKIDKLVVNVEGSSVSAGSTALEVLQKAPGITMDKDDNISMKGKQGVLVMIDGKQTYMSNGDLANLLRNMQSNEIELIELITNPSAKYDAAGNSGIINIKTKKNKSFGTNGSLVAGMGYGKNYRTNSGLTLNHRQDKVNLFVNYNYSNNQSENLMVINRLNSSNNETTYFGQTTQMERDYSNNNFKAGVDYSIDKKNTIGVLVNGYMNGGQEFNNNNTLIGSVVNTTDSSVLANNRFKNRYRNMAYNMNYKSSLDTNGKELSADFDYSRYSGRDNVTYDNYYFKNAENSTDSTFTKSLAPTVINIKAFKIDYTHPLSKTAKLEAGIKASWVKTDNDSRYEQLINQDWTNDIKRSNQFIYDENVSAAYINASKQFNKTSVQVGLRAEQTTSKGNSVTKETVVKRDYLNLFPSLFVNHDLSEKHSLGFSYSRRIDRPSYDALNDFVFYLDQYTFNKGNPYLKPQFTNSYEVTYSYRKTYNLTLSHSLTKDVITEVLIPDTTIKALYQTNENLEKQIYYGLNLNLPLKIAQWWSSNNNINSFYLGFKSADLKGVELDNGKFAYEISSNQNFTINKSFSAEMTGNYRSRLVYGTFNIAQQYSIDAGLSKSFANKKVNVKFSVSDIFNTRRNRISSAYQGLTYQLNQKHESRVARLTLTYRFGNNNIKTSPQRTTGLESETKRMKN